MGITRQQGELYPGLWANWKIFGVSIGSERCFIDFFGVRCRRHLWNRSWEIRTEPAFKDCPGDLAARITVIEGDKRQMFSALCLWP